MKTVTIVDYGLGNLFSVRKALEFVGGEVIVTNKPQEILEASRLVLPGVGAFADGIKGIKGRGLFDTLREYCSSGKPFLGICLGMQMLFDSAEEFGSHEGLKIISGRVVPIPLTDSTGSPHKVPHIGWAELYPSAKGTNWKNTILDGFTEETPFYFVHSFSCEPQVPQVRLADCSYDGRMISAVVHQKNIVGCQFHPEKSGPAGLKLLRNFLTF